MNPAARFSNLTGASLVRSGLRERDVSFIRSWDRGEGQTLIRVSAGILRFRALGRKYRIGRNEMLCCDSDIRWEHSAAPAQPCTYHVLDIRLSGAGKPRLRLSDIGFPPVFKTAVAPGMLKTFKALHRGFQHPGEESKVRCSALLLNLFLELRSLELPEHAARAESGNSLHFRIRKALLYINANYKQRISLQALARHVGLHPVYLSRLFKRQVGVSPHRYMLEYKIRKARDFLGFFDEAAVYTGQELGFQDYSHFFRTFKRLTGRTPVDFVRRSGKFYDPR